VELSRVGVKTDLMKPPQKGSQGFDCSLWRRQAPLLPPWDQYAGTMSMIYGTCRCMIMRAPQSEGNVFRKSSAEEAALVHNTQSRLFCKRKDMEGGGAPRRQRPACERRGDMD
jgi:hypothetical protein